MMFAALFGTLMFKTNATRFSLQGSWTFSNSTQGSWTQTTRHHPFAKSFHGFCSDKPEQDSSNTLIFDHDSASTQAVAIESFLNAVSGKRVLFLGDSLTLQIFAAFLMIFRDGGIGMTMLDNKPFSTTRKILVVNGSVTMRLLEFYRLKDVNMTGVVPESFDPGVLQLSDHVLEAAVSQADIVIANIGLHHWYDTRFQALEMQHLQQIINRKRTTQGFCSLWRSTLPQHFPSLHGTGLFGDRLPTVSGCAPLNRTWTHPSEDVIEHVRKMQKPETPLIDMTSLLEGASAFHSTKKNDCSHWCFTPSLFVPMLSLFAEAIQKSCTN